MMRAKFQVSSVTNHGESEQIAMGAVGPNRMYNEDGTGDEDNTFSRWTPCAHLQMTIQNPDLIGKIKPGDKFYVDFTLADK